MGIIRNTRYLFEQQLRPELWDWSEEDKKLFEDYQTNRDIIFKKIYDRLREIDEEDGGGKMEIALVIHDKDISYGTKLVEPHIHAYIDFKKRVVINRVASALGLEKERIETPKSKGGRQYSRINTLAYLIHAKDKDKYQYPVEDVETFGTIDYETFINQNKEDFEKFAATRKREKSEESLDLVLSKVQSGELNYFDVLKNDDYAFLYANNQQKFRDSFNFCGERDAVLRLDDLQKGNYQLTVLYIQGKPGIGKSTLAKDIITMTSEKLKEEGLKGEFYSASAKNPFDNYYGEEILLMDDLRSDSLSATDWLKLFDPINSAKMSARYQNKLVVPRLVIVSAYMSPKQFFGAIETEDLNQYLRRITLSSHIGLNRANENRVYSVGGVRENKANDFYQRSNGSSVVLNFDYEELYTSENKEQFIQTLLTNHIYPRILPKKIKDVTEEEEND